MMRRPSMMLLACCIFGTSPLQAQSDTAHRTLLPQLQPGTAVRVLVHGARISGRVQRVAGDTLYLQAQPFATRDLERVWLQQRSTRQGMKIGAIIGAPAGALFGGFIIWLADALCESSCDDLGAGTVVLGTLGFSAFGLVAGGALGATIGAGIPRWVDITDSRVRVPEHPPKRIGSFAITPAYARFAESEDGGGFGARVAYTFETRHIAAGLEGGKYSGGTTQQRRFTNCTPTGVCFDTAAVSTDVSHIGAIARVSPGSEKRIEPYGSVGLGFYSWSVLDGGSIDLGGYSLGAGVEMRNATGKRSLFAEARWHANLTRSGDTLTRYGFYSVGFGATLGW